MERKKNVFKRLFAYTLLALNILVCIWSALCYIAAVTEPERIGLLQLASLSTAFAFFANFFFVFFWLFTKKKWRSLIGVATLLVFSKIFLPVFGWHFFASNEIAAGSNTLKVMQWNVHAFGLYDGREGLEKAEKMLAVIKKNNPDVLCLDEYFVVGQDSSDAYTQRIMRENGYKEYRFKEDNEYEEDKNIHLGTAIFSRYPLADFLAYPLSKKLRITDNGASYLLQTDVLLPVQKKLRLFALHLYSSGISTSDINFIEKLKGRKAGKVNLSDYDPDFLDELHRKGINPNDRFKVFIYKLTTSGCKRAAEADSVAKVIANSPYPVLICGDINDVPSSYVYTTVRGKRADLFVEKGRSLGRTFNAILPTLRIDDVFYDPTLLKALAYKTPNSFLSDHKPVIAVFEIKK